MCKVIATVISLCCLSGLVSAQTLDDPTRPTSRVEPATTTPSAPPPPPRFTTDAFQLADIYVLGNTRRARINDEWYERGDRLRDGEITHISASTVTVATAQREYVLTSNAARATFRMIEETP